MRDKIPIIIGKTRFESISEASERLVVPHSTLRSAVNRAFSNNGVAKVSGMTLKIDGPCDHEVSVTSDKNSDTVEIKSGKSSITIPATLVNKVADDLKNCQN